MSRFRFPLAAFAFLVVALLLRAPGADVPQADAAAGSWTGQYYNSTTPGTNLALTRDDGATTLLGPTPTIDFEWAGSPGSGVNADGFSVRWTRSDAWAAGTYRFTAVGDDGIRVYFDQGNNGTGGDVLIVNGWQDQAPTTWFHDFTIPAGTHGIRVEFYDATNAATAQLRIENVTTLPAGWTAQYYNNSNLTSLFGTRTNEPDPFFEWGDLAPIPGMGVNTFSARWTRTMTFNEGVYEFSATSDDGVRIYVDGTLVLDYWIDQGPTLHSTNVQMTAGSHQVVVEYYENTNGATMIFGMVFRPDLGGFVTDSIVSGLNIATVFDFAPDGRIFIGEKGGAIRIFKDGALLPTPYYTVTPVNTQEDRGLLGLALDPNFATNGFVYVAYTYDVNPASPGGVKTAQVIRLNASTPSSDVALAGSKTVILGSVVGTPAQPSCDQQPLNADCIPSDYDSHTIGNLQFGPDGMLYVATGDGASYASVDSRALRSQSLDSLAGKVLRLNPANGQGLADNPFYNGNANHVRSKVWAYGFRNPFRFSFKPGTNTIFNGDVGWNDYEEQNVVLAGGNYGWPCYEGNAVQPGYQVYSTCQNLAAGNVTFGIHVYSHPPGASATGGVFTGINSYPPEFQNTYFFGDYARSEISTLKVDGSNIVIPGSVNLFTSAGSGPVQFEIGPEGDVYYLAINAGQIRRIRYVGGNRPPVAAASADPMSGLAPLNVSFSSVGSNDPDGTFGFGSPTTFSAGTSTHDVDLRDLNGDTLNDMIAVNAGSDTMTVRLGNGDGTFGSATTYATADQPKSVALGLLNGDAFLDAVTANQGTNNVSVLLGNGNGTFQAKTDVAACSGSHEVTLALLNADTNVDIACAGWGASVAGVLRGNGNGTFQAMTTTAVGTAPHSIVAGLFNADAIQDLAVANHDSGNLSVLIGNGNGTFQAAVNYGAGTGPHSIRSADLNADSKLDLVVANDGSNNVSVLLGLGNGTFTSAVSYGTGQTPKGVAIADIDSDGRVDILTANIRGNYPTLVNPGGDSVSVLLGDGDGTFQPKSDHTVGQGSFAVAVGLIDGDSRLDIATANWWDANVTVRINTVGQPLTYLWDFGDGQTSTLANPTHQYTTNGNKTVTLTVSDPLFLSDQDSLVIQVGNTAPTATIAGPADNSHYDIGDTIVFSGSATDTQDGTIPSQNLAWTVLLVHCFDATFTSCHDHTHYQTTGAGGQFPVPDHGDYVFYEIYLTATDSGGLTHVAKHTLTANLVGLTFQSNPTGIASPSTARC